MHKNLVILICLFNSLSFISKAQESKVPIDFHVDTNASLSVAYGWYYNAKNGKWISKPNEIKSIDRFENYTIISFSSEGEKYIAIIKKSLKGSYQTLNTYIIDYDKYVDDVSRWENKAILKFPILKHHVSILKKSEVVTYSTLGLDNMDNLLKYPRNYFVFQYRFEQDSMVKFLFYTLECNTDTCIPKGLEVVEPYPIEENIIGTDALYERFFYKAMQKSFADFIDSPIQK